MKRVTSTVALLIGSAWIADTADAAVTFATFVNGGDIAAVEGQQNTIAYTYAGNKFVGSVYFGGNNLQLYSTDLNGGGVAKFGTPLPTGGGEVVLGASLGLGGFPIGDVYAGSSGGTIYHYANSGGAPSVFGSVNTNETVRQILFDPGNSFGGKMLVSTTSGNIYRFDSTGTGTIIASVGEDTEGLDIASSAFGKYAGQLLVTSEGSGKVRAISPGGVVTVLQTSAAGGGNLLVPIAETISVVPVDLGLSGNPLEGFYVANYPVDIQKANASQFAGMQGDAIVTSEDGSNARIWRIHYEGDAADAFTLTQIGNLPNQSEDGIFVTAQRIQDVTVPEPATLALLGGSLLSLGVIRRRRKAA